MMGCTCSWSGVNLTFIGTRSFTINTDVLLMTVECSTLCWSVVQCAVFVETSVLVVEGSSSDIQCMTGCRDIRNL